MAKRAKQLALCGALAATGALSLGSAHALAIPPDSTLPQSCHGSVVSNFVHEVGGTGDFYPANPGALGDDQRIVVAECKALKR